MNLLVSPLQRGRVGAAKIRLFCLALTLVPLLSAAQSTEFFRSMNQPCEPFRIIGNLYYVGASDIASYLIVTPEGHILIEGGFEETAPLIEKNIRTLGFKLENVKFLLTSHAHLDHAGGLAELKRLTGAKVVVSEIEAEQLARGGKGDFQFGDKLAFPPVRADQTVEDKDEIRLGGTTVIARLTPGHTKGNLSWTLKVDEEGKSYDVVIMGSVTFPGYKLLNNADYPDISTDFSKSFAMLKTLPCDVFLAPHGYVFSLRKKRARQESGAPKNPFIDPQGYQKAVTDAEQAYQKELESEQQDAEVQTGLDANIEL